MVGARAQVAAWSGKVREARQLYEDAARMAELRKLRDVATSYLAWATFMELAYGNGVAAAALARRVLGRRPGYDPRLRVSVALAATGSPAEAESIANEPAAANPEHTFINR